MIQSVASFVDYFAGIRRRTLNFIRAIPVEQVEWSPQAGEFTCGDIVRHIAAAERMFVGVVVTGRWVYEGHKRDSMTTPDELLAHLDASHIVVLDSLRTCPDTDLMQLRPMLQGTPVKAWRILMAMVEHEIHHRSQLAMYLTLLGVKPPHIYGLSVEDVIALAVE